jgi:hypothetical protein
MLPPWIAGVLAAALLASPVWAAETETGRGANSETELTRFSFHPSIEISGVIDDEVELGKDDDVDGDFGFFIVPRVELGYQGPWFDLGADLGADIRQYTRNSSPSDQFYRMSGFAEFGLMPGLTFALSDAWVPTPVDLGLPEDASANLVQSNRASAELSYWRELPAGSEMLLSVQGTYFTTEGFRTEIGPGTYDNDFHADFWEGSVSGEIQRPLFERTSTFMRTKVRYRTFDDQTASDYADIAVLVGIRTHWHRDVDFDIAGGYGYVDFDSGSSNRFVGQANLRYRMPYDTTLRVSAVNRNTVDLVGNDFMETRGEFGLERRFGERTAASVEFFISRFDSDTWSSGSNLYGGVQGEIRRQLTRRTQLALNYRYWDNGGDRRIDDFTQNRVLLTFSYRR